MKKTIIVSGVCAVIAVFVYLQINTSVSKQDPRGNLYAGSETCAACHNKLYNSYLHTAHHMASLPATDSTVNGSFVKGANEFIISDSQKVVMEKLNNGLFQTYYLKGKTKDRFRFDIVFGGVKGESYLYWKDNELYQLPLSYFSGQHQWSTSPGFPYNFFDYPVSRSVGKQCMECHASYIANLPGEAQQLDKLEKFDERTMVYSIDCERCHGPAAQHVDFHTKNPAVKTAGYITTYSSLNRLQKLDLCAVCHSGKPGYVLRSTFGFVPGDTFANFKLPGSFQPINTGNLDVHGNQLQLLQRSKCFIKSTMDCATCHDTHQNSRGNEAIYVQKCLACHNSSNQMHCKMTDKISTAVLETKCISCHMPALPTKTIAVQVSYKQPPVEFFVHTHHIAIYPQEVKKVLDHIN